MLSKLCKVKWKFQIEANSLEILENCSSKKECIDNLVTIKLLNHRRTVAIVPLFAVCVSVCAQP